MKSRLTTLIICIIPLVGFTQNEEGKTYYKDKNAKHEARNNKGSYIMTETLINDSIVHKEFSNTKTGAKLWVKEYLHEKPYGIWSYYMDNGELNYELNYQFVLKYGEQIPQGFLAIDYKNKKLTKQVEGKFEMPKLGNQENGFDLYIRKNIEYPIFAQENGIQGKVFLQFTVDKEGKTDNISIIRGVHESLDREAFRLIHSMGDWTPATLNGEKINIYLVIPISFQMQ
jgi:protein TonB